MAMYTMSLIHPVSSRATHTLWHPRASREVVTVIPNWGLGQAEASG